MTIEWLDPQPIDVVMSVGMATSHTLTQTSKVGVDEEGSIVLTDMRETDTGELKCLKLMNCYPIGEPSNTRAIVIQPLVDFNFTYTP